MPTYQYACTGCDERLEVVQKFSDEPLTECPACAGRLRKVFSPVGVVFKGSGFYKTDSRSGSSGAKGKDTAASGSSSSKDSSSSASGAGAGDSGGTGGSASTGKSAAASDSKVA